MFHLLIQEKKLRALKVRLENEKNAKPSNNRPSQREAVWT